jgi:hypothetical protein
MINKTLCVQEIDNNLVLDRFNKLCGSKMIYSNLIESAGGVYIEKKFRLPVVELT